VLGYWSLSGTLLSEAVPAQDVFALRLEWHLARLPAVCAHDVVHLALTHRTVAALLPFCALFGAAVLTASGLAKALLRVEFLLTARPNEFLPTVAAGQGLILHELPLFRDTSIVATFDLLVRTFDVRT
jgi:hypothetical protein